MREGILSTACEATSNTEYTAQTPEAQCTHLGTLRTVFLSPRTYATMLIPMSTSPEMYRIVFWKRVEF